MFKTKTPLGVKLKKLRKEKKLTQVNLSKLLGFSDNYITKIENGQKISMNRLHKLAEFFEMPVEYLVSEREDSKVVPSLQNQEILEAILKVDEMEHEDRRLVLDLIEIIVKKDRFQEQARKKKGLPLSGNDSNN
jgi:transcriptional regulator with XRE-family HTH domain